MPLYKIIGLAYLEPGKETGRVELIVAGVALQGRQRHGLRMQRAVADGTRLHALELPERMKEHARRRQRR